MSRKTSRKLFTTLFAAAAFASLSGGSAAAATTCAKVAAPSGSDSAAGTESAPYRTPQKLAGSLSAGQTGCLRGGSYTTTGSYILSPSQGGTAGAPITVTSYPGERAKLVGIVHVPNGVNHVTLSRLDFEGTGTSNTIKIYSADVVVEDSDITNAWRGLSCMMLGSNSGAGQAVRTIIRRNTFHECGNPANGNKDHGIYAASLADGEIVDNVIYNSAAYAIQFYPNTHRTRFAHNVVDGGSSVRGGVIFAGEGSHASGDNTVEQNVIGYAATYNITSYWGGSTGLGNVARSNCVWGGQSGDISSQVGFAATGNKVADPGFVGRSAHDYRLKAGSACLATVGYDTAAKLAGALPTEPEPTPTTTTTTTAGPAPSTTTTAPTTTTASTKPAPTTTTSAPKPTTTTSAPKPTTTTSAPKPTTTTSAPAPTTTTTTSTTTTPKRGGPRKRPGTGSRRIRSPRRCRTRRARRGAARTSRRRASARSRTKVCRSKARRGRRTAR
jgi:hypothetical protein